MTDKKTGLDLLRVPFEKNLISKLPKPTKAQTDEVKADYKKGIRCKECGGWHHPQVVHLDYVGHAALTDRLLSCDINWNWEPISVNEDGTPKFDENGGMWIKLTVCGISRIGYGHPDGKKGGDALKETIGDALRNAAMRFGAALELWHKGDLTQEEDRHITSQYQQPQSATNSVLNYGDYVINFSKKFKGKKLSEVTDKEHQSMIDWLLSESKKSGKDPVGSAKEYLEMAMIYLNEKQPKELDLNEVLN